MTVDTGAEARIRISEIFGPTIQGEGALIGQPTVFVRTGGCDYRCSWCDTLHAVDPAFRQSWEPMTVEGVWDAVVRLSSGRPLTVSLSGGNPAIQPLGPLIRQGQAQGYRFALETQGSLAPDWLSSLDVLTLSPKPPSSGMATDWERLDACMALGAAGPQTVLKMVVFDEADYAYARGVAGRYPGLAVYLQPGNATVPDPAGGRVAVDQAALAARLLWLVERVLADRWFEATVLPQLHVTLWGNARGV
jgi:7-carboxy-7-deazaguanine synthase